MTVVVSVQALGWAVKTCSAMCSRLAVVIRQEVVAAGGSGLRSVVFVVAVISWIFGSMAWRAQPAVLLAFCTETPKETGRTKLRILCLRRPKLSNRRSSNPSSPPRTLSLNPQKPIPKTSSYKCDADSLSACRQDSGHLLKLVHQS